MCAIITLEYKSIDALLKGKDADTWTTSLSNEFDRLAQGIGKVGTLRNMLQGPILYSSFPT